MPATSSGRRCTAFRHAHAHTITRTPVAPRAHAQAISTVSVLIGDGIDDDVYTTVDACEYYQAAIAEFAGAECGEQVFTKCRATQVLATIGMAAQISMLVALGCGAAGCCNTLVVLVGMFHTVHLGAGCTAIWSLGEPLETCARARTECWVRVLRCASSCSTHLA